MTNSKDARSIEPRSAGDDDVAHEMRSLPRATSHRLRLARRLQSFDTLIAVLGAVAPCMIGPLRAFAEAHTQRPATGRDAAPRNRGVLRAPDRHVLREQHSRPWTAVASGVALATRCRADRRLDGVGGDATRAQGAA